MHDVLPTANRLTLTGDACHAVHLAGGTTLCGHLLKDSLWHLQQPSVLPPPVRTPVPLYPEATHVVDGLGCGGTGQCEF